MRSRGRGCGEKPSTLETADHAASTCISKPSIVRHQSRARAARHESAARPKRIFLAHTAHEISGFVINPGPAAWIVRFPAPPSAKTHPVPANDCLRTHDRRGVADFRETPI